MTAATGVLTRRAATAADEPFLRTLFTESRDELALLPDAIAELQWRAQQRHFEQAFPQATHEVIVVGGVDVGRLVLAVGDTEVHVVELAVARGHRRQGIASRVLAGVIGDAADRPVTLQVWATNAPARALYDKLGFRRPAGHCDDAEGYLTMHHSARA